MVASDRHSDTDEDHDPATSLPDQRLTSRSIRSFVIRNGRMTAAQSDAMSRLMPRYGIDFRADGSGAADLHTAFDSTKGADVRPIWLEIGIGNGDALLGMAEANPDVDLIGVEVHAPGIGHALLGIESRGLTNVRLIRHDALEVLETLCPPASLARVMLFFPDPWHKKRHHKRRIVRQDFLDAVAQALTPGGLLHCATDVTDYSYWMHEHIAADSRFANTAPGHEDVARPQWRPETRFERRGERLGHAVHDLLYRRC